MKSINPKLVNAIDALKEDRVDDALRIWRDHQEGEGVCDTYLCDNANYFWTCCANHFQGWLLTLSLSGNGEDYFILSKKIGKWIEVQTAQQGGDESPVGKRLVLPEPLYIGHPSIDRDHKNLIKIINDISVSIENNNFDTCAKLLDDFLEFMEKHFHREEDILKAVGFPELADHGKAHTALMEKSKSLAEMIPRFSESESTKDHFYTELVSLLFEDAIKADFLFKTYLINRGIHS